MALTDPNNLSPDLKAKLSRMVWNENTNIDLHALGVNYYNPEYLPTWISPAAYAGMLHRGLTPPMALPIHVPENTKDRIEKFLEFNYHKLTDAGVQYLGTEANVQKAEEWDSKKLKVCLCRLSDYHTLDGAFGGYLIGNFLTDYTDDVFVDYSFFPNPADLPKLYEADLPIMFGSITKRPLTEFDIVIIASSYPGERVNLPVALLKSGLPLYRWQRFAQNLPYRQHTPILALAGIGASFIENMLADNPRYGLAGNAAADHILIGEGEMMDLKYIQQYFNTVILDGGTKEDFMRSITNTAHTGVYDPSLVLFEYADKIHTTRDHTGKILAEQVYQAGGHIKSIYLVDHDEKVKHSMAGRDSQEFRDLEPINAQYQLRFAANLDPAELGRRYIKISDRPNLQARKDAGMTPMNAETSGIAAEDRKAGLTKVVKPS